MSKSPLVEPGRPWVWAGSFTADPRGWILDSAEPAAWWSLFVGVLDRADEDDEVATAHRGVLADPVTQPTRSRSRPGHAADPVTQPTRSRSRPGHAADPVTQPTRSRKNWSTGSRTP
ncbi:MAG: hypothetical protein ACYDDU_09830 [Dermatophilaceae bacterium]